MTPAEVARKAIAQVVLRRLGRSMGELAIARLEEVDINALTIEQVILLWETGVRIERMANGEPASIIRLIVGPAE